MSHSPRSVEAFGAEHAKRYDRDAHLLMGDRDRHRVYLADLLQSLPREPRDFVDLACGTGYLTEVFFEVFPAIRGTGIDGSESMLDEARSRFRDADCDIVFRRELLQTMDWSLVGTTSLVFSAFAFHHLAHDEKRVVLGKVFEHLGPGGTFVLFDLFRPEEASLEAHLGWLRDEGFEGVAPIFLDARMGGIVATKQS